MAEMSEVKMRRLLLLVVVLGGCASDDGAYADEIGAERKASCITDVDCGEGELCFAGQCVFQGMAPPAPGAADAGVDPLPQEQEQSLAAFTVPAAGREHVWVASPETDTLVRIHGATLAIDAIEVGDEPTEVRTRAGDDAVVVDDPRQDREPRDRDRHARVDGQGPEGTGQDVTVSDAAAQGRAGADR